MACKCRIGRNGQAERVDALLDAGKSLDAIATATGFHRSMVYRHSHRCRDAVPGACGDATAADQQLLKYWTELHKKSVRAKAWDAAARALDAIGEIRARLAARSPQEAQRDSAPLSSEYIRAIRRALGYVDAAPGFRLLYDDADEKHPYRTRRLTEAEFLSHLLKRQGWRMPLIEVLTYMLEFGNCPEAVRLATEDFLTVLDAEDRDGNLGLLKNAGGEEEGQETGDDSL